MQMLVAEGRVSQDQLEAAVILQAEKGATVGYHLVNLVIHVTAGLLLFGIMEEPVASVSG